MFALLANTILYFSDSCSHLTCFYLFLLNSVFQEMASELALARLYGSTALHSGLRFLGVAAVQKDQHK
ncbi:hypothetical protein AOLI_G00082060 [Acnodon oligacanthus]